jgi:uncharacterized protein YuzE
MVSVTYDRVANAIYVKFNDCKVAKTIPLGEDKYLDIDENGKAIGLEVLFNDMPEEVVDALTRVQLT